jgi:YHS domain-containing protein
MKRALLALSFLALPALVIAEDKCPISGAAAKDVSLEVNGAKVSFCCDKCPEVYKKKIALKDEGPKTCPACKNEGKKEHSVIQKQAEVVHFCCANCAEKFDKKLEIKLEDKGIKDKKCPMSGGAAKDVAGSSVIVNGEKIYFCCANCPKKFRETKLGVAAAPEVGKCPLEGAPGKAETEQIIVKSKVLYFCCDNCKSTYAKANFKEGLFIGKKEEKPAAEEKRA